jgi:hypothetical protein
MTNIFDRIATEASRDAAADDSVHEHRDEQSARSEVEGQPTSPRLKLAVQELLRHGHIEETEHRDHFRNAIVHGDAINAALEPLDLTLRVDTHRGVVFLAVAKMDSDGGSAEESWNHPLVRKQRLTLEQSLLVAILRQSFARHEQESGVGQSAAKVAIDDLLPTFLTYVGDSGSDSKNENRLWQLLEQLKTHGIVSEVDQKQEVTIRPLIAHVANPETLGSLLAVFEAKSQSAAQCDGGIDA